MELDIINAAIACLGSDQYLASYPEKSKVGQAAQRIYPMARLSLFAQHEWESLLTIGRVWPVVPFPVEYPEYPVVFTCPNSLRLVALIDEDGMKDFTFKQEGRKIYAMADESYQYLSCSTTSASASVTVTEEFSGDLTGAAVAGTGIPAGAYVLSHVGDVLTLSANATATGTPTLHFTKMKAEYVADSVDETLWEPALREAMAYKVATLLAATVDRADKVPTMNALYERALNKAREQSGAAKNKNEAPSTWWVE